MINCDFCKELHPNEGELCDKCLKNPTIRSMYSPRRHHTPEFLAKLKRMAVKAEKEQPLFDDEDVFIVPKPRCEEPRKKRKPA